MPFDAMPGYDRINVVRDLEPVEAVRDQDAAERMVAYPELMSTGGPDFGCAEQDEAGWRILTLGAPEPSGARYDLAAHLRRSGRARAGRAARAALEAAAGRLDPDTGEQERVNELTAAGRRYRIIRSQGFARIGEDGPEPPRSTDLDPPEPYPARSFPLDPLAPVGSADATLRVELLGLVPSPGPLPERQRREAVEALSTHPGVLLLPTSYTVTEFRDGGWQPLTVGHGPDSARESLAFYFREVLSRTVPTGAMPPTPEQLDEYARAAELVDGDAGHEFALCGRRFRTVRVINMIRVGPDGPEPARISDEDCFQG